VLLAGKNHSDNSSKNRGANAGIRFLHAQLCPDAERITLYFLRPNWATTGLKSGLPVVPEELLLTHRGGHNVEHEWWFTSLDGKRDVQLQQVVVEIPMSFLALAIY
jgi:hypothetical protein